MKMTQSALLDVPYTNRADTRKIIDEAVKEAFDSICSTMGPNGRQVVINQLNEPVVTKDGVSVAKALDFGENRQNMIAKLIREPSMRVDTEVGDGTTTTVFITTKLYQAFKDSMEFQDVRFVDQLVKVALTALRELIVKVDVDSPEFEMMLMTTSNYEVEIVQKVLELYKNYQAPNIILARNPNLPADSIEEQNDIQYEGGYAHQLFANMSSRPTKEIEWNNVETMVIDGPVELMHESDMAKLSQPGGQPVVIFAKSFSVAACQTVANYLTVRNDPQNNMKCPPVMMYRLNAMGTLGSVTIAEFAEVLGVPVTMDLEDGIKLLRHTEVNYVTGQKGVVIDRNQKLAADRADKILERIVPDYEALDQATRQKPLGMNTYTRIGILRGNNVKITVTGQTVSDCNERYYRYEDVMKAAKTAINFGVLPGIGWGYLNAADAVEKQFRTPELSQRQRVLLDAFLGVLRSQYEYLTGYKYKELMTPASGFWWFKKPAGKLKFIDLTTGEETSEPEKVYDNAAATCLALEAGWATAKTLGKLSTIQGRSNTNYLAV